MRKIGIFGGSFDPVHFGHLRPALEILEALSLDSMQFIPSGQPPHRGVPVASAEQRLAMLKAALADEPRFQVDERELRRAAPSYTYDTLTELKRERPGDVLVLVLGLDAFLGLPGWHRWHELLDLAHIAVAQRPGWDLQSGSALTEVLRARQVRSVGELFATSAGRILLQPVTPLEISSTQVRTAAAEGGDLHHLVPETVRRLIQDSHCYA
jgi:nicotinate-nucleotide adenylyltransferase